MAELQKAQDLLEECDNLAVQEPSLKRVCQKLARKIKADVAFLEKHVDQDDFEGSSSNIPYLSGVLKVVKESSDVQEVICDFRKYGITVDVVCDGGKTWKKVIARNPQSLHLIWAGKGQYGTKDVVRKAERYCAAAKRYCEFSPPSIVCVFCNGVTHEIAKELESINVQVVGERIPVSEDVLEKLNAVLIQDSESSDSDDLFEKARKQLTLTASNHNQNDGSDEGAVDNDNKGSDDDDEVYEQGHCETGEDLIERIKKMPVESKVFLDITTMLVYVSDVCHGGCDFEFKEKVLAEQAAQERIQSALDKITPYMKNKTLITCQSALDDYLGIVNLLGGPSEKKRSDELIGDVIVVPDCISEKFSVLSESGQIRKRSKVIFGSADTLRCDILTSNEGFVRAAAGQGVYISALLHEPRALSEQKRLGISTSLSNCPKLLK